ncbi:MAG: c-type cytochrome [Candidatus Scalindua sp.]
MSEKKTTLSVFWYAVIAIIIGLIIVLAIPRFYFALPGTAVIMYIMLLIIGVALYITYNDEKLNEFVCIIKEFLRGKPGQTNTIRMVVLVIIPLLIGWSIYIYKVPKAQSPTGLRIQHPTIPGKYEKLENPLRNPEDEIVKKFIEEEGMGDINLEKARELLVKKYMDEGRALYQINCRPCHGSKADGAGPMAGGFRLKPVDFRDPGTIATVVESFAFWRVTEGGAKLPVQSTPWDSAMPIWGDELTEEEKWKIIMAEYDTAGVEPRIPEELK